MPFGVMWSNLLEECEALGDGATLVTPLSGKRFRITDAQEYRIIIEFRDSGETRPLKREQFETLYERVQETPDGFALDRLPPDADPFPAVISLHPRYEVDESAGIIRRTEESTGSQLVRAEASRGEAAADRTEPDLSIYADALLLIDALERHEVSDLTELETPTLVNLYTLLSDIQRGADDFRKDVADVLLDRIHHDRPVHGQFGSVQRTARQYRSLKNDDEVLAILEEAGIDRERVTSVDTDKVDEALEVIEVSPDDVYEIEDREYVRKAEVDEERKETRLQGLKDQLRATDEPEAEELRAEIEDLEDRIEELTEFKSGRQFHTSSSAGP